MRRHLLTIVSVLALAGLGVWIARTASTGRRLRRNEEHALDTIRAITLRELASSKPDEIAPYVDLPALLAGPARCERLSAWSFAPVPVTLRQDLAVHESEGYWFAVVLLDERGIGGTIGKRFKALAWPASYGHTGTVFYWSDPRGNVYQGENAAGNFSGRNAPLDEDPIRDRRGDPKQFANRWRVFERPDAAAGPQPPPHLPLSK